MRHAPESRAGGQAGALSADTRSDARVDTHPIRVVVADDSYLVREALARILSSHPSVELVARCSDARALVAAVEEYHPAVVVTDIRMPPEGDEEGIRVASELRRTHPDIGVVVLSQYADPRYGLALLGEGSEGRAYLLKERVGDRGELVAAIEAVARGGSVIDAKVVESLVRSRSRDADSPLSELTQRELEVLGLVAQGMGNAAIGGRLFLSKRAVEKHVGAIFMKLSLPETPDVSRRVMAALIYLSGRGDASTGGPLAS